MKKPFTPDELWDQGFNPTLMAVYLYISMRDGGNGCWESKASMAKRIGTTRPTLRTAVKTLVKHGWLVEGGGKIHTTTTGSRVEKIIPPGGKNHTTTGKNHTTKVEKISPLTNKGTNKITKQGTDQGAGGVNDGSGFFFETASEVSSEDEFSSSCNLFPSQETSRCVLVANTCSTTPVTQKCLTDPSEAQETGVSDEFHQAMTNGKTGKESVGYVMQYWRDQGAKRERWEKEPKLERIYGD